MIYKRADDLEGVKTFKKGDEVHFWCGPHGWKKEIVTCDNHDILVASDRTIPCLILGMPSDNWKREPDPLHKALKLAFPGRKFCGIWPAADSPGFLVDLCRWLMQHAEARWGKPPVEKDTGRPRVGDLVRVVDSSGSPNFCVGDIGEIIRDDHDGAPYNIRRLCDGALAVWLREHQVELVQRCFKPKEEPTAPRGFEKTWAMMEQTGDTAMIATLLSELLPIIKRADICDLETDELGDAIEAFTKLAKKS